MKCIIKLCIKMRAKNIRSLRHGFPYLIKINRQYQVEAKAVMEMCS